MPELVMVIDGHSLMYRAFYALPMLETPSGVYTNAVVGFMNMLLRAVQDHKPLRLCVAFDSKGPTFRHERYDQYKAGRKPQPDELRPQFGLLKELLAAMKINYLELPGWEADDILGTVSQKAEQAGLEALLVTGDRDALQLISSKTRVLLTRKGISELQVLTPESLKQQMGYDAAQVPDLKALMGDASDNIPGVPKVGEKTALKLLEQYGSLEEVLAHANDQTPSLKKNLIEGAEQARESLRLATIDRNAPIEISLEDMLLGRLNTAEAQELLRKHQMAQLLSRLKAMADYEPSQAEPSQPDLTAAAPHTPSNWRSVTVTTAGELAQALKGHALPAALHFDAAALSVAFSDGVQVIAPFGGDLLTPGIGPDEAARAVKQAFPQGRGLTAHDCKQLRTQFAVYGVDMPMPEDDTLLGVYLLDAVSSPTLQKATERMLGEARTDASGVFELAKLCQQGLEQQGMTALYRDMELPLCGVLFDMERAGFLVDLAELASQGDSLRREAELLRAEVMQKAGRDFNLNSPKQLAEVLFDELNMPVIKKTATGRSTDAEVLEQLAEQFPICGAILQYRHLVKLIGTYIDGLSAVADPRTSRVHTTLHQALTFTGRISSSEPNLQNIPVRTDLGRRIRRAFVAPPGHVLLDADYSQIELRVLAHMSGDPAFVDAFISGQDIHARTASEVFGVPLAEVTPEQRSSAKAINFGMVYGISEFGLARNIGTSRGEAADIISRFFARYPKVKTCMDGFVTQAKTQGYVETLLGRRRRVPELLAKGYQTRMFGERVAMNTPIQGTAADIIKLAMVSVPRALAAAGLKSRLILQVHDELIVESPEAEARAAAEILRAEMERVVKLSVPLVAEVGIGTNWLDAK